MQAKKLHNPILEAAIQSDLKSCQPIDHSPIHKWAETYIRLRGQYAITGDFRVGLSTWMIPIFEAIKDHSIREIAILAATQMGKSLVNDLALHWHIVNRPIPTALIMQSNVVAEQHMESRLIPTMMDCPQIQDFMPKDKREVTKQGVFFKHMPLYVHGASEGRLQSKSLGLLLCSELWQWNEGSLEYARKRTKQFYKYGMSKVICESQGGTEDSEWDRCYKMGTMEVWSVPCPNKECGKYFAPDIAHLNVEGKKWNDPDSGVKNEDGTYNYGKLSEKLTMQCPHCNHLFKDSEQLKQFWSDTGKYIVTNPNAMKAHRSFQISAFPIDPWIDITIEFLEATRAWRKGVNELLLNFFKQRCARNVSLESMYAQNRHVKADVDYNPKDKWEKEIIRFLTIDTQEAKFVYVIRAWAADGSSRLITFGEAFSVDELVEIQKEWGVMSSAVWIDTGGTRTREIYAHIIKYGWFGVKGVREKRGFKRQWVDKKGRKQTAWRYWQESAEGGDPAAGTPGQGKMGKARFFLFCVNPIKDILVRLRDGKGVEWLALPSEQFNIKEYNRQCFSEFKKKVVNKYGGTEEFWVKIKQDLPNDIWDAETYQVGAALLHPSIDIKESMAAPMLSRNESEDNHGESLDSDTFTGEQEQKVEAEVQG